ncbi:hypothetical protein NC99_30370 [Sunxiuqinia dokdonensis]|uniref:Uncharacterized protein n=1 Tax=Sunxiuqinia dokdonensis TaxID=1409788 RepID=A0A0L8V6H5_9BACT|nr:hypothetical protein NC99_30370 [Sunxiuqinia dokdonensis]
MVRLVGVRFSRDKFRNIFQFQYGAIGGKTPQQATRRIKNFNSSMVRLVAGVPAFHQ